MKNVRRRTPSGAILIAVLACLLVAISLVLMAVQSSIRARRECKDARLIRQTQLLAEAGAQRAIEKLREFADYDGEVWMPKLAMEDAWKASVQIRAEPMNGQHASDDRKFTIIAKFASNALSAHAIQKRLQFIVHKSTLSPSEP